MCELSSDSFDLYFAFILKFQHDTIYLLNTRNPDANSLVGVLHYFDYSWELKVISSAIAQYANKVGVLIGPAQARQ